jgi:hypothetical protein
MNLYFLSLVTFFSPVYFLRRAFFFILSWVDWDFQFIWFSPIISHLIELMFLRVVHKASISTLHSNFHCTFRPTTHSWSHTHVIVTSKSSHDGAIMSHATVEIVDKQRVQDESAHSPVQMRQRHTNNRKCLFQFEPTWWKNWDTFCHRENKMHETVIGRTHWCTRMSMNARWVVPINRRNGIHKMNRSDWTATFG